MSFLLKVIQIPNFKQNMSFLLKNNTKLKNESRVEGKLLTRKEAESALDENRKLHCFIIGKIADFGADNSKTDEYACLFVSPRISHTLNPNRRIFANSNERLNSCVVRMSKGNLAELNKKDQITLSIATLPHNKNDISNLVGYIEEQQGIHVVSTSKPEDVFLRTDPNHIREDNLGQLATYYYFTVFYQEKLVFILKK